MDSATRRGKPGKELQMGTREDSQPKDKQQRAWGDSAVRVTTTIGIVAFAFAALWFVVSLLYALL